MKSKSTFRAIYKLLKTNSHEGGVLLSKIIDIAIKQKIKPLDVNYKELRVELEYTHPDNNVTECSIDTAIYRFMEVVRGNKEVVSMFSKDCNRLTANKFIISLLSLYYHELELGIIKRK